MKAVLSKRTFELEGLIEKTKEIFSAELKTRLDLIKVNAPLFVSQDSGLNDGLNGVEKAVAFNLSGKQHEVVHSLAKWKRWVLGELEAPVGKGIVTDMRAIRADEVLSPIHSHLVDQWDWEKVISKEQRTVDTLIEHGKAVYDALKYTEATVSLRKGLASELPEELKVIHTEDLLQLYPDLSAKDREHKIAEEYGAVLLIGIGGELSNGEVHDLRAPDYDDWSTTDEVGRPGLNADLLVWDKQRELSLEISSMGVRVDEEALERQLALVGKQEEVLPYHRLLLDKKLPYTIGGGIGQSRVAMFIQKEADIKEVQPLTEL